MMNILEKILGEIEKVENEYCHEGHNPMFCMGACSMAAEVKEIIRSYMDDLLDTDTEEKSILCTLGEDGVLSEYDDTYDVVIHCTCKEDQEQTVKLIKDSNWIPVSERLPEEHEIVRVTVHSSEWISDYYSDWIPENEKIYNAEEYNVYDGYIDKSGDWIFFDEDSEIRCDKKFGADKSVVYSVVTAWMPKTYPKPYHPTEE